MLRNPVALIDPDGKQDRPMQTWKDIGIGIAVTVGTSIGTAIKGIWHDLGDVKILIHPITTIDVIVEGINIIQETINRTLPHPATKGVGPTTINSESNGERAIPKPKYPVPEIDWETGQPKDKENWIPPVNPEANWTKPKPSKEYVRPDLSHPEPIGPHVDWRDKGKSEWRIFPDKRVEPKK